MKVTITIDNVQTTEDVFSAVWDAWYGNHMEGEDGKLYRGHRQFSVGKIDMTYTSADDLPLVIGDLSSDSGEFIAKRETPEGIMFMRYRGRIVHDDVFPATD